MMKTIHGQSWYTINVHLCRLFITGPSVIGEGPRGTIDHDYNHVFKTLGLSQQDHVDMNMLVQSMDIHTPWHHDRIQTNT